MITINRPMASIVAAAANECIQLLITGRRDSGKQDGTPSAGRSGPARRLVAKFFKGAVPVEAGHPHGRTTTAPAMTGGPKGKSVSICFCLPTAVFTESVSFTLPPDEKIRMMITSFHQNSFFSIQSCNTVSPFKIL